MFSHTKFWSIRSIFPSHCVIQTHHLLTPILRHWLQHICVREKSSHSYFVISSSFVCMRVASAHAHCARIIQRAPIFGQSEQPINLLLAFQKANHISMLLDSHARVKMSSARNFLLSWTMSNFQPWHYTIFKLIGHITPHFLRRLLYITLPKCAYTKYISFENRFTLASRISVHFCQIFWHFLENCWQKLGLFFDNLFIWLIGDKPAWCKVNKVSLISYYE